MIEIKHIQKSYDCSPAVADLCLDIKEGEVFGLLGTNGAGKSTLMRMMAGVIRPDAGEIRIDGAQVYDNPKAKRNIFFLPDSAYYFPHSNAVDMQKYYSTLYPDFDRAGCGKLLETFGLDQRKNISTFSKGMKKQLFIAFALSSGCRYLLMDETFDGLDPEMRQGVKTLIAQAMVDRGLTPVITSHNLREIEDICDTVGLMHKGKLLTKKSVDYAKSETLKIQVVFDSPEKAEAAKKLWNVSSLRRSGAVYVMFVKDTRFKIEKQMQDLEPVFYEILPLTLEEIFINEVEGAGYDIKKLLLED